MAVNSRYIQYYTSGTAAEKLTPALSEKTQTSTRKAKRRVPILYIDPAALLGSVTAVILMVCMFVGLGIYNNSCEEYAQMDRYVSRLERQNQSLTDKYEDGYDLEQIRLEAVLMGYVPESQVQHITVKVPTSEEPAEQGFWEVLLTRIFS